MKIVSKMTHGEEFTFTPAHMDYSDLEWSELTENQKYFAILDYMIKFANVYLTWEEIEDE